MAKKLQEEDNIVESVLWTRKAYHDFTDEQFAVWYERKFKIPEKRVLAILKHTKEGVDHVASDV